MFRSFIYLDEEKLYTYKRQLEGKNAAQPKAISQKKAASFNAGTNGVGISSETEINVDSEFERDVSFDYDCFEQALSASESTLSSVIHKAEFWERNRDVSFNERQRK